jgi:restriction system protein
MGYEQVRVQGKTGDEGVDLTMHHSGVLVIAQCKRYTGNVGAPALRDFYGTLMHTRAAHGFFITTSGFTGAAQDWAAGKPIQLVTGGQLVTAVRRYLL